MRKDSKPCFVCLCVRQRLGSHSLDLTLKNSSGSLKIFFLSSTQLCFRFCFLTGNFLLFSLSVSSSVPVVTLTTDTSIENSWGCWIHFPVSLGESWGQEFLSTDLQRKRMACARVTCLHRAGFDTEVSLLKSELAMFSVSQFWKR